jgi:hypothetical protein
MSGDDHARRERLGDVLNHLGRGGALLLVVAVIAACSRLTDWEAPRGVVATLILVSGFGVLVGPLLIIHGLVLLLAWTRRYQKPRWSALAGLGLLLAAAGFIFLVVEAFLYLFWLGLLLVVLGGFYGLVMVAVYLGERDER